MIPLNYILAAILFLGTIVNILVGIYSSRRRNLPGSISLSLLLFAMAVYMASYGMELLAANPHHARLWLHVQYFSLPFLPALIVITVMNILQQKPMPLFLKIALFIIPAVTFILELSNKYHHLYYSSIQFISNGIFYVQILGKGIWYWVQTAYINISFIFTSMMSIVKFFRLKGQFKKISGILSISLLFPWAGHIVYIAGANPLGLDINPFAISITTILLALSFFRQRLLDILPMAYDALFYHLPDGVLVVDEKGIIAGHNPSAEKIFNTPLSGIQTFRDLIPELLDTCTEGKIEGNCTIEKKVNGESRWIDIRGNIFQFHANQHSRIITLRDITEIKKLELMVEKNAKNMREEITAVRNIQAALMPDFSHVKGYDIASVFLPAGDLSGDFVDGYFINDEIYQIVICDVMGHGLASAYLGMEIRSILRAISKETHSPAAILAEVNDILTLDFSTVMYFATAAIVQIHLTKNHIIYSSAGHPPALYLNADGNITETGFTGPLLGLRRNNVYRDIPINFCAEDYFFLYTDGAVEAKQNGIAENFEIERLKQEISICHSSHSSSRDCLHTITSRIFEFTNYTSLEDDISMICFTKK